MSGIRIGDQSIGRAHRPLVIAEMSGNHNHSLDRALSLVDAAAEAGAHALKLQTYTPDTLTLDVHTDEFVIRDESPWKGQSLHDLYKKAYTPWEWHKPIMERAKSLGMECFSTPFDESAVEFLETLDVPAYKIASFEVNHIPLIRAAAATKKPLIISTAMATITEIEEAVQAAREVGNGQIVLLKCTSAYPAKIEDANVLTIPDMRERFQCEVGLSDHTLGISVPLAAVALGATVIEKHFTLRRADGGTDASFSLEPKELHELVVESENAWKALGKPTYGPLASEKASLEERRSLYVAKDMKKGEQFTKENMRCIRPALGLPPKYYERILGKKITADAKKGTALRWELIEGGEVACDVVRS